MAFQKKKSPKYIQFTSKGKDVFTQNVDKLTRDLTRGDLETAYLKALDLPHGWSSTDEGKVEVPEQVKSSAKDIEEQLYKQYSTQPKEYLKQLSKLAIFLDPKHYVGQFANMFRVKTLQSVYKPDRLVQLDITDMLPEVFLNPKADPAAKLDVYQNINRLINERVISLRDQFNSILNPTARRPTRPSAPHFESAHKLIAKNKVDVKDLCENPYWKMKKVNMIICKEDNKFYCLDIQILLNELAENNTATNYFTKKALPQEISDNLRSRYANEIAELKDGADVEVGRRTMNEYVDLQETLTSLTQFQEVFNRDSVLGMVELFGLDSVEDPQNGGVKNILNNIPAMVQDEFNESLEEKDFDAAVDQINTWLDSNIAEIKGIIEGQKEDIGAESPEDNEPDISKIIEDDEEYEYVPSPTEKSPKPVPGFIKVRQAEEKLINEEILTPDSVSRAVYDDYLERLEAASKTILEALKKTHGLEARQELNTHLFETNSQLKEVRSKGRSITGIIYLLQSSLTANNAKLAEITDAVGMALIYPEQLAAAQQEKAEIEQFVKNLQTEIAYLEELNAKFIEEQKALGNIKEY